MRKVLLMMVLLMSLGVDAQEVQAVIEVPATVESPDTIKQPEKKLSWLRRTIRGFSYIDTNYVEPQHYDWSVMVQASYNYDFYRLSTKGDNQQSFYFAPTPTLKMGPYFGWRWAFLGYTFDLRHVDLSPDTKNIEFSFYSAQIGADFQYRRTGSDYKLRNVKLGDGINTDRLENVPFDGINTSILGLNVYYIFNHQRFSYPAAFNQSTCQKISCGSWMVGLGYTQNSISFDYDRLQNLINELLPGQNVTLDDALKFNNVKYYDTSVSLGYAYNWVFAKHCLFCASLSAALAYKKTKSESSNSNNPWKFSEFSFSNFNLDGIGRFGLVYNDTRWYAGASAIIRAYTYRKAQFAANNVFGVLNVYLGYNFGLKKEYRKKR